MKIDSFNPDYLAGVVEGRDLEICSETISNDPASLGYFEHHFGKV